MRSVTKPSLRMPPRHCDRKERSGKQSTSQTPGCPTIDCHGLRPRRDNAASLRAPPSLCERSEAIHFADRTVSNHGLPRRYAPRRDGVLSLRPRGTWRAAIYLSNHAGPAFQHMKRHYNANISLPTWFLGIILPFIICMIRFSALYCLVVPP